MAMKILQHLHQRATLKVMVASAVLLVVALFAASPPATGISKGYATDDQDLRPGMVASLSNASSAEQPKVERASQANAAKVIGIATTPEEDLVTIASGDQSTYVQTSGEVSAYVTDVNGAIKAGDLLALSPLRGILMKAASSTTGVVAIALQDFDEQNAETKTIQGDSGSQEVKVGKISVNLDHKASQQPTEPDSSIERIGRAITGKDVGEIQVLAAFVIFLIVLVAEGGIIYGAVSSGVAALGRNPMARTIIIKEMVRVIAIALAVLFVGLAAIYAILWI
jgi:hypothetical protein